MSDQIGYIISLTKCDRVVKSSKNSERNATSKLPRKELVVDNEPIAKHAIKRITAVVEFCKI